MTSPSSRGELNLMFGFFSDISKFELGLVSIVTSTSYCYTNLLKKFAYICLIVGLAAGGY